MLLIHKINVPIYNSDVIIIVGDGQEAQEYMSSMNNGCDFSFESDKCDGICFTLFKRSYIWLRDDVSFQTLTHELCHCVFGIMRDVGLDVTDEEAFCYLIHYLLNQCKDTFAIQMAPIKQV